MLKLGFDGFSKIKTEIVESSSKTFIQSFEDLWEFIKVGKTIYFQTDEEYGMIRMTEESKVFVTIATCDEIDRFEGTARNLQKIFFYLQGEIFVLA